MGSWERPTSATRSYAGSQIPDARVGAPKNISETGVTAGPGLRTGLADPSSHRSHPGLRLIEQRSQSWMIPADMSSLRPAAAVAVFRDARAWDSRLSESQAADRNTPTGWRAPSLTSRESGDNSCHDDSMVELVLGILVLGALWFLLVVLGIFDKPKDFRDRRQDRRVSQTDRQRFGR